MAFVPDFLFFGVLLHIEVQVKRVSLPFLSVPYSCDSLYKCYMTRRDHSTCRRRSNSKAHRSGMERKQQQHKYNSMKGWKGVAAYFQREVNMSRKVDQVNLVVIQVERYCRRLG